MTTMTTTMTNTTATAIGTATVGTTAALIARDTALEKLGEELGRYYPYNSQLPPVDVTGTRIVKVMYRNDPKLPANEQKQSVYVRVPAHLNDTVVTAQLPELLPHVIAWLESLEDSQIKEEHKAGLLSVYTDKLSLAALIDALESSPENAGRLTKEKVESWFSEVIEGNLALLFADKLGLDLDNPDADLSKLVVVLNAYKGKFAALSSPKCFIKEEERAAMIKVIVECGASEEALGSRFIARLQKMAEKTEEVLLCL